MNFKMCSICGHADTQHVMGGLCADEGCTCVGFRSGISKIDVRRTAVILDELLAHAWQCEQIHAEGFAQEERIDMVVRGAAKLHGWR